MDYSIIAQNATKSKWRRLRIDAAYAGKALYAAAQGAPALMGRAYRMAHCSEQIIIEHDAKSGASRVAHAALCRDRLCPLCSWRLAVKRTAEMQRTIDALLTEAPYKGVMLTLTVKNCRREELGATVKMMNAAFARLRHHRAWKREILGYARSVEITYNPARDEYHPHIHALLLVPPSYTATTISQDTFARMWQTAAALPYKPIVDVRFTYSKDAGAPQDTDDMRIEDALMQTDEVNAMREGIIEATKYALKPSALRRILADEELADIAVQLAGHRLVAYGGAIKSARAALGYTDADKPDAEIEETELPTEGETELHRLAYRWSVETQEYVFAGEVSPRE